jgi:uncharacterized DUF497 family protein
MSSNPVHGDVYSTQHSFTFYINIRYTIVKDLNRLVIVMVMVFNATFNNISVISWRSVLLMEETGVSRENH